MRKIALVLGILVLIAGWVLFSPIAFHDASAVSKWIAILPGGMQESYVLDILKSSDQPIYKKAAILDAWLSDLQNNGGKFHIHDFTLLMPVTRDGGEPFSEPVGLLAAKVIVESGDCTAINVLRAYYSSDEISSAWISERLQRKSANSCVPKKAKP